MPSTRATTLPRTGTTKTPRRARCPWDTALSPSWAYRATQTSNRQPERPYTLMAAFKQLRLQLGILGGGHSTDKRASSHPRPGGGPTAIPQG